MAALCLMALSGCGTTVSSEERARAADAGLTSDGLPDGTNPDPTEAKSSTPIAGGPIGGTAAAPNLGPATGTHGGPTPATGDVIAPTASRKAPAAGAPLLIGVQYLKNNGAAGAAIGAGNAGAFGGESAEAQYQAVIDSINAGGGVLGHKVKPVFYGEDAQSADISSQDQAACARFTQDYHVFAALLGALYSDNLTNCLGRAGVVTFSAPQTVPHDQTAFDQLPYYATAGTLNLTRLGDVLVDGLVRQKYFAPGSKIGVVTYDAPSHARAVERSLKPALARHGLRITDLVATPPLNSLGNTGNATPQIQNAVLRFASEGIDRVIFFAGAGVAFVWMTAAESQGYRPRYAVSTHDAPSPLAANAPATQMANSVGVGWNRMLDVASPPANNAGKACDDLMRKRGLPTAAWVICDHVQTFARALVAGGQVAPASTMAGLQRIDDVPSATVLGLRYSARQRDGAARARALSYTGACSCFRYTSAEYAI
jgi:ABC-type branched-subunit amino acid transport system substrate-binding protein